MSAQRLSAGLLLHRGSGPSLQVLLVHPGGPYWAKRDLGAWSIPKGEYAEGDDPLAAARREFAEETGAEPPAAEPISLGEIVQAGGKRVMAFAVEGEFEPTLLRGNTFECEWPPRSGRRQAFPEVDRAGWFSVEEARLKLLPAQAPFLDRLAEALAAD